MSEESYQGILIKDTGMEAESSMPAGVQINDTELDWFGSYTHDRLLPRRLNLKNNTRTDCADAEAVYTFYGDRLYICGEDCEGSCVAEIDGISGTVSGAVWDSGELSDGEHFLKLTLTGGYRLDRLICAGKQPERVFRSAGNTSFCTYTNGARLERTESGSRAFIPAGEQAELCFDGDIMELEVCGDPQAEVELYINNRQAGSITVTRQQRVRIKKTVTVRGGYNLIRCTVKSGTLVLRGFETENLPPFINFMNDRTDEELAAMADGTRSFIPTEEWKPVECAAQEPRHGVVLGGLLKQAFERNIRYLKDSLKLPRWVDNKDPDRIWIDMLVASNEGRILGGIGNTLRYQKDDELRAAAEGIINEAERRQFTNGNGYMLPYESSLFRISEYGWPGFMRDEIKNYDRTMFTKGLLAMGDEFPAVYPMLRSFYDWFNGCEYLPLMLLGAMGIQGSAAGPRVGASPAGKPEDYITNMKYYDMDWWLDALACELPEAVWRFTLNRPHNYLLTSICALFDIYLATGSEKYFKACVGARNIYKNYFRLPESQITICEHFECRPWTHYIKNTPNSIFETCAAVFWTDLNLRFLKTDPENQDYITEIEQSLYNIMLPCQGEDGRIRYFNQMQGKKYPVGRYNTCCEIQATAYFGELPQYVFLKGREELYVNLFADASITTDGTLTMKTAFPDDNYVELTADTDTATAIRIPCWSEDVTINIGDEAYTAVSGTYFHTVIKAGEKVSFTLKPVTKSFLYDGADRNGKKRYSFMRGPVLMAVTGDGTSADDAAPLCSARELALSIDSCGTSVIEGCTFMPYYKVPADTEFNCFPPCED